MSKNVFFFSCKNTIYIFVSWSELIESNCGIFFFNSRFISITLRKATIIKFAAVLQHTTRQNNRKSSVGGEIRTPSLHIAGAHQEEQAISIAHTIDKIVVGHIRWPSIDSTKTQIEIVCITRALKIRPK